MDYFFVAHSNFALNLLRQQDLSKTFVISPRSISVGLATVAYLAKGPTGNEIREAILMKGLLDEHLWNQFGNLQDMIKPYKGEEESEVQVYMANKFAMRQGPDIKGDLHVFAYRMFNAGFMPFNFRNPELSSERIDMFVSGNKHNFEGMVPPEKISADTDTIMANVMLFKGRWKERFNVHDTEQMEFWTSPDSSRLTDFMAKEDSILYSANDHFQVIRLKFSDEKFALNIFLPKIRFGLMAALQELTPESIYQLLGDFQSKNVKMKLPKFKIESTYDLQDSLVALGIRKVFDPKQARFKSNGDMGIIQRVLRKITFQKTNAINVISMFAHKAIIEIDEYGASATTAVIGNRAEVGEGPSMDFVADHPFMFMLTKEDRIFFMGLYN
ncbi:hypothetical protein CAEBREN_08567 [Caenorhabditis brenneri]|uniref:Serpin domain-containing protein n=1 Tax=Caenorhabditis brenneri TaxID=135651 RepID=G0M9Y3_CAEBE|nr:hypothetical protein CAEBREN_08567 [Caenorhabditis brenneri]